MFKSPGTDYDPKLTMKEVGVTISRLGIQKANILTWQLLILGFLAGVYISFGSHLFLVAMEQGMGRIVAGACFGVGLVLVVIAGAELFTGKKSPPPEPVTGILKHRSRRLISRGSGPSPLHALQ